jgi:two-component system, chemotaxis family, chemotaxis protein CheY
MKTLIVEDDFTSRLLLQGILKEYGPIDIAVDGKEAVFAVKNALLKDAPYNLICLDIMMPEMDGQEALKQIRAEEQSKGISSSKGAKIFMTTALSDVKGIMKSFDTLCDAYMVKPLDKAKLLEQLSKFGLI